MNGREWTEKLKTLKGELVKEAAKQEDVAKEVKDAVAKAAPLPPQGSIIKEDSDS